MVSTHRARSCLIGCAVFCMVVSAQAVNAAQSRPESASIAGPSAGTAHAKGGERPDVARFRKRVETILAAPGPDKSLWGVLVTDATTGQTLFSLHPDKLFTPASDEKLFTMALALATLGPDYRIRTTLETSGTLADNGVLHGDLVLVGRGDANLSNRKFPYDKKAERDGPPEKVLAELADAAVARGLKHIEGDFIADDSLFQAERFPSGWTVDDMLWSYGAAVSAIAVNDNTFTLELRPGAREGDPATFSVEPASDFYTIENTALTGARRSEEKLAVAREPGSRLVRVSGTIPAGAAPRRMSIAIEEPAEYAAELLARLLTDRGVQIGGRARARHATEATSSSPRQAARTVLAEHISVPLSEVVRLVNKNSENLNAELLLLLAAREKAGATTREEAVNFAAEFFKTAGIPDGDLVLYDGSGLSRLNLVTPRAVVQILVYAASQPWGELYRSTLPVAGEDGTLADRMKNTSAAGRVFAKTGTEAHINALSGYATTVRGARLIFSILGNNSNLRATDANRVINSIVVAMVEELRPAPAARRSR
jgi:D-alanyl-D-alanine carboxypeptidase/D-alanyl-D-alanine-endopeptidase (penicillin-binding protein 4)